MVANDPAAGPEAEPANVDQQPELAGQTFNEQRIRVVCLVRSAAILSWSCKLRLNRQRWTNPDHGVY